jgi:hypothetical protein
VVHGCISIQLSEDTKGMSVAAFASVLRSIETLMASDEEYIREKEAKRLKILEANLPHLLYEPDYPPFLVISQLDKAWLWALWDFEDRPNILPQSESDSRQ